MNIIYFQTQVAALGDFFLYESDVILDQINIFQDYSYRVSLPLSHISPFLEWIFPKITKIM